MSVFESTSTHLHYTNLPTITFDEELELYIGELVTRTGVQRAYGPSQFNVEMEIERLVYWEYQELLRHIEQDKPNPSASASVSASPSSEPAKEPTSGDRGHRLMDFTVIADAIGHRKTRKRTVKKIHTKKFGNRIRSLLSRGKNKVFVASVAGVTIMAGSRKQLKKELIRERNKHIQRIMMNVRTQKREEERVRTREKVERMRTRIRTKRLKASEQGPSLWAERSGNLAREKHWETRLETMRERIREKKAVAMSAA